MEEKAATVRYNKAKTQVDGLERRWQELQQLSVFDRTDEEETALHSLESRLQAMRTELPDLQAAMAREHRAGDVDQAVAEWDAEGHCQLYANLWAALLEARKCAKILQQDSERQDNVQRKAAPHDPPVNVGASTVLKNLSAILPGAMGWDFVLNGQEGILPVCPVEQAMAQDPGCKPIARRTFFKVLREVA